MPHTYKVTIKKNDLGDPSRKVIIMPIMEYVKEVFEAFVNELIIRFKDNKDTPIYILVCDSVQAHLLLYKKIDILKFSKINATMATKDELNAISRKLVLDNPQNYMSEARAMALDKGLAWMDDCKGALNVLRGHFESVTVVHWNNQVMKINDRYQAKLAVYRDQRKKSYEIDGLFELAGSALYLEYSKEEMYINHYLDNFNKVPTSIEHLQPPASLYDKNKDTSVLSRFAKTQTYNYSEEVIVVLIEAIKDLLAEQLDRSVCLIWHFPTKNNVAERFIFETTLIKEYMIQEEKLRLIVPTVCLNKITPPAITKDKSRDTSQTSSSVSKAPHAVLLKPVAHKKKEAQTSDMAATPKLTASPSSTSSGLLSSSLVPPTNSSSALAISGLSNQAIPGDGHCLFSAVALYTVQTQQFLRNIVAAHLEHNLDEFRAFIQPAAGKTIPEYLHSVREGKEWADNIDIEVLMRVLNRPIVVIGPEGNIRNRVDIQRFKGKEPIFVNYNGHNHYDAFLLREGHASHEILQRLMQADETYLSDNRVALPTSRP